MASFSEIHMYVLYIYVNNKKGIYPKNKNKKSSNIYPSVLKFKKRKKKLQTPPPKFEPAPPTTLARDRKLAFNYILLSLSLSLVEKIKNTKKKRYQCEDLNPNLP